MINYIIKSASEMNQAIIPGIAVSFVRQDKTKVPFTPKFEIHINGKATGIVFDTTNINSAIGMASDAVSIIIRELVGEIVTYANANSGSTNS